MFNLLLAVEDITNQALPEMYNTQGADLLSDFLANMIEIVFIVAVISFLFLVAWGAVQWIMSGGDKGAVQSAQSKISNAVIGLIVLFATYAILTLTGHFFNIEILESLEFDLTDLILGN